ncbi:hypothetical protein INT45_010953 [Circinella minor]|uniref:Uncharacterized protein n=1 Tax=Circinella minor TaxID=1195481 RepID=A0A8H7RQ89_9FUNG|nr:hypothetical protein INT45_010953 [Circinella minor]
MGKSKNGIITLKPKRRRHPKPQHQQTTEPQPQEQPGVVIDESGNSPIEALENSSLIYSEAIRVSKRPRINEQHGIF